jgi:hypothetical protein
VDTLTVVWVVVAVFVLSGVAAIVWMTLGLRPVHTARAEADRRWSELLATLDERRTEIAVLAEGSDAQERAVVDDALAATRRSRLPRSRAQAETDLHRAVRPLLARQPGGAPQVAARARLEALDAQAADRRRAHDAAVEALEAKVSRYPGSLLATATLASRERFSARSGSALEK